MHPSYYVLEPTKVVYANSSGSQAQYTKLAQSRELYQNKNQVNYIRIKTRVMKA